MQTVRQAQIVAAVFFLLGFGLLVTATYYFFVTRSFVRTADTVRGRVIALEQRSGGSGKSGTIGYAAVFTFTDASGQDHTVRQTSAQNPPTHKVGDEVVVLYHPSSPDEARIRGFRTLWILPTILAAVGGGFACVGAVAFFSARKALRLSDHEVAA